jgi:hypothetical protein
MTNTITSQNIDLSLWITLYISCEFNGSLDLTTVKRADDINRVKRNRRVRHVDTWQKLVFHLRIRNTVVRGTAVIMTKTNRSWCEVCFCFVALAIFHTFLWTGYKYEQLFGAANVNVTTSWWFLNYEQHLSKLTSNHCVTPSSRVPLQKLIVAHLVKKFPVLYGSSISLLCSQ